MNKNSTDFFLNVAKHHLERFHSECLTWALNFDDSFIKTFICNTTGVNICDIEDAKAISEIENIDILISYKVSFKGIKKTNLIHVENKVKANESFISDSKIEKLKLGLPKREGKYSQTEYYFLRNLPKSEKKPLTNIRKTLKFEEDNFGNWYYVYLIPVKTTVDDQKYNSWTLAQENLWIQLSYVELISYTNRRELNKNKNNSGVIIFNEYFDHLKRHFSKGKLIEFTSIDSKLSLKESDTILSTDNLNLVLDKEIDTNIYDEYSIGLYFKLLESSLTKEITTRYKRKYKVRFITETGNNNGYTIDIKNTFTVEIPNLLVFSKKGKTKFRIGIQFEQNSPNSGKLKYYFADELYTKGLVKNQSSYRNKVQMILKKVFEEEYLIQNTCLSKEGKLKFNGSTSKSFCSFLRVIKFSSIVDFKKKILTEMDHLDNRLNDLEIQKKCQDLFKN